MYLVFTRMPGESYRMWLRSLLYLCYVFRGLINSLVYSGFLFQVCFRKGGILSWNRLEIGSLHDMLCSSIRFRLPLSLSRMYRLSLPSVGWTVTTGVCDVLLSPPSITTTLGFSSKGFSFMADVWSSTSSASCSFREADFFLSHAANNLPHKHRCWSKSVVSLTVAPPAPPIFNTAFWTFVQ